MIISSTLTDVKYERLVWRNIDLISFNINMLIYGSKFYVKSGMLKRKFNKKLLEEIGSKMFIKSQMYKVTRLFNVWKI